MREAGRRVLGQRHFDVQIMGGAALHLGWVSEMKTGEGKTLVATLPSYLNALAGRGVHLVTVNDYLARRDAEWMGRVHRFLGLDGRHRRPRRLDARREARATTTATSRTAPTTSSVSTTCATTWSRASSSRCSGGIATSRSAALLRDRRRGRLDPHRRGPHAAHHLRPRPRCRRALLPVRRDRPRSCSATATTRSTKPSAPSCPPRRASRASRRRSASRTSTRTCTRTSCTNSNRPLRGKELFKRDDDYIIADGEVKIVDEFTGRILEGRRWSEGLHQAVEAKEGVQDQRREPDARHGHAAELLPHVREAVGHDRHRVHGGRRVRAHVQPPGRQRSRPTGRWSATTAPTSSTRAKTGKIDQLVDDIAERNSKGQPVLVGTISVEKSEEVSRALAKKGIPHEVLNAKQHEREAEIITQAGQLGAVTVATNMAGRGVDILLGGNPEGLAPSRVHPRGSRRRFRGVHGALRGAAPAFYG